MLSIIIIIVGLSLSLMTYLTYRYDQKQIDQLRARLFAKEVALTKLTKTDEEMTAAIKSLQTRLNDNQEDPITHLLSKHNFEDRLKHAINESKRLNLSVSLLLISIDNYKIIEEVMGSQISNAIISEISQRLQNCIRQVDSMTRWTSDVFACQLTLLSKPDTVVLVVQRMLKSLQMAVSIKGQQDVYVMPSIGIAVYPLDAKDMPMLISHTEMALVQAKTKGGQTYHFYQKVIYESSSRELTLSTALRSENFYRELVVRYHPTMDIEDESIFSLEMEVLWKHPHLGMIDEKELLKQVDYHHQTVTFYEWIARQTFQQFITWQKMGLNSRHLILPVSIKHLENNHFMHSITQLAQELNFDLKNLIFAITDVEQTISYDVLEKSINMLKYMGVKLLIKNFGQQAFSLSYFKYLDINFIELDKNLTQEILQDQRVLSLTTAIFSMMQSLSIPIIIRNIESDKQRDLFKLLGVKLMEGRLFADTPVGKGIRDIVA